MFTMQIYYDSLTGLSKKMALLLSENAISVKEVVQVTHPCLLITRSIGFGQIPDSTRTFIENNRLWIKAVAVSGNKNWGQNYGAAGDKIQTEYGIPLILKFEAMGLKEDLHFLKNWIKENDNE